MKGMKFDNEKLRWTLLPFDALEEIIKVLMLGAKKYADDNWKIVMREKDGPDRYLNAGFRHLSAYKQGKKIDSESGLLHLAHAGCCILFLLWGELNKKRERK